MVPIRTVETGATVAVWKPALVGSGGQALRITELREQGIIELIGDNRWPADWPRPAGGTTPQYRDWNGRPSE
jgi:hypothetical protein